MPSPHRQSCRACVIAKRKCDQQVPCQRCRGRGVECTYESGPSLKRGTMSSVISGTTPSTDASCTFDLQAQTNVPSDGPTGDMSMIDGSLSLSTDLDWADFLQTVDVDTISMPSKIHSGSIFKERTMYTAKQLKKWPEKFAKTVHTPWINMNLYKAETIPTALRVALATCSLYAHRTRENEQIVYQSVSESVSECIEQLSRPMLSSLLSQRVAQAQAACLYIIIGLYDGDVTLRAEAESALPTFVQTLQNLGQSMRPASDEAHLLKAGTDSDLGAQRWKDWLLHESLRRTLVTGFTIEGTFNFLKHGWDDESHFFDKSFTAQRRLWDATNWFEWNEARQNAGWFPIQFGQWDASIANAQPSDLEELGVLMMALVKGLDYLRDWLGKDNLVKHSLLDCRLPA